MEQAQTGIEYGGQISQASVDVVGQATVKRAEMTLLFPVNICLAHLFSLALGFNI